MTNALARIACLIMIPTWGTLYAFIGARSQLVFFIYFSVMYIVFRLDSLNDEE